MRGNRTGRKGLPRFAPLLYIRQEIYGISRFNNVTFITYGKSPVQSLLRPFTLANISFWGLYMYAL